MRSTKKSLPVDLSDGLATKEGAETIAPIAKPAAPRGGTDPRQIRSATALREALLTLLERKAFDQITVREIAAEAGVNNSTFFRHYVDKQALLDTVAADEISRLVAFSLPWGPKLDGNRALCSYVNDRRALWKALFNGGARAAMREEYLRLSREVAAKHTGSTSWLPNDFAIICSTMLIIETISWWLSQSEPNVQSGEEIAVMLDLLLSATTSQKPPPRRR
ncbi:TetR/AcrR family transcriptional regulator [Sphingobium sufflavum]|uniref:TetR/AcrR family transcriptional regulator n=1 Tax=Sphingobium sufflavum TaxID=1129547 RepID=UPI001F3791C1|nr:TetR/AcrR family transcriptional regulator [Sphingobium sufflavum]MCE7798293.1 TetR/AcrR family transcriptional regulator [Sphingobium sufflavum]